MKAQLSPPSAAAVLFCALAAAGASAQSLNLSQSPLFLGTSVKPNVLVMFDNSQSMDGTMSGKLIAGDDLTTRGNIARSVLRSTITSYRDTFNWGLGSFALSGRGLYTTYAYFFGSDAEVVFTNDCVNGLSASNGNRRCVANPQPANGLNFITYQLSGDDPAINDVLYTSNLGPQLYGIGVINSTRYAVYGSHNDDAGNGWVAASFGNNKGVWSFTPTDAGFLPQTPPNSRIFWLLRAWGYNGNITGSGVINQAVAANSTAQYDALMSLLANETRDNNTLELKNAALFTPLTGSLQTARSYFSGNVANRPSPITESCQRNFVLLATDGNPTGRVNGTMYPLEDQANTKDVNGNITAFSVAANDVFSQITALRTTPFNNRNVDVQTYVIGLGDSVANADSVATLNRMAVLGGTNAAYLASDQDALAERFRQISVDIISRTAAASSVSLNSGSWTTGSKVYQGRFSSSEWSGQLLAFPIATNGTPGGTADWDAGQRLNAQNWNTGRQILTYRPGNALGSRGVAFRWPANPASLTATDIDSTMVSALNHNSSGATDGFGQQRLNFLRGAATRELRNCATCSEPVFRNRQTSVLGDIVNSAPVYVGGPTSDWRDTLEASRYSSYANSRASQAPVIFVGANDGMLHAFNANNGNELFAYVPYAVRNKLSQLTANPYTHTYTVDGSPSVGDVYVGGWKTMLVAGMNAGAKGVYALDISNPSNFNEANAAQVVRWEVGNSDNDVGYVFGRPILAKMADGRWRAIVGNGYNSTNGHAVLLLIDLETGGLIKIDSMAGDSATPNGLSSVTAISSAGTGIVDAVYAGDLRGNLWKFDLSAAATSQWKVAYGSAGSPAPLFAAGSGQSITARPDVTRFPQGGYMVVFGTGRYVDISDNGTTGTQTIYGVWDNGSAAASGSLQTQSFAAALATGSDGRSYRISTHAVDPPADTAIPGDNVITRANYYATKRGWRLDLPSSGERVVAEATVRAGRAVISTLIPSTEICSFGGDGWIVDVDVVTGNRVGALDTNADNLIDASDAINGVYASAVRVGSVPAAATIMRNRQDDDKLINTSAGSIVRVRERGSVAPSRRSAWEQIR